jgi:hypothetical protein
MANNGIPLPFTAFKDMMMGRIPEEVYSNGRQEMHENTLRIVLTNPIEDYYYDFLENRLMKMTYVGKQGSYVQMDMDGRFKETVFPQTINVKSQITGGGRDIGESLFITFRNINTVDAKCPDSLFLIPGHNR